MQAKDRKEWADEVREFYLKEAEAMRAKGDETGAAKAELWAQIGPIWSAWLAENITALGPKVVMESTSEILAGMLLESSVNCGACVEHPRCKAPILEFFMWKFLQAADNIEFLARFETKPKYDA